MGSVVIPETKAGGNLKIEVRRVIRASRQRIYEAWTRPEEIMRWFVPGAMTRAEAEADARVGGRYRIVTYGSMEGKPEDADRHYAVEGVYETLIPGEVIAFTWKPDWSQEAPSIVTVRLRDVAGGTEMTLTHERIETDNSCSGYTRGWSSCVEKLAAWVERPGN